MDYGQPVKADTQSDFFTSGAGTNQENLNNFESENNLDLSNQQTSWSSSSEKSNREIGNIAISQPETRPSENETQPTDTNTEIPDLSKLGQVVDLEMPPGSENSDKPMTPSDIAKEAISYDQSKIKTEEKLNSTGVQEVENIINKLSQDENAADFYDAARDMMETNLDNSYKRKLAS